MTTVEFNENFNKIEDLMFGFAMKLTKNRDRAKDLMQETLMRAFKNRDRFKKGTNFKAWVSVIMRNSFINDYRKQRTRNQVEQPMEESKTALSQAATSETAYSKLGLQELVKLINSLSDLYSVPFKMFYEGYSYIEISEKLNIPIGTVKSRIFFARRELKKAILQEYITEARAIAA